MVKEAGGSCVLFIAVVLYVCPKFLDIEELRVQQQAVIRVYKSPLYVFFAIGWGSVVVVVVCGMRVSARVNVLPTQDKRKHRAAREFVNTRFVYRCCC